VGHGEVSIGGKGGTARCALGVGSRAKRSGNKRHGQALPKGRSSRRDACWGRGHGEVRILERTHGDVHASRGRHGEVREGGWHWRRCGGLLDGYSGVRRAVKAKPLDVCGGLLGREAAVGQPSGKGWTALVPALPAKPALCHGIPSLPFSEGEGGRILTCGVAPRTTQLSVAPATPMLESSLRDTGLGTTAGVQRPAVRGGAALRLP
jgi:hypothetical protein